MAGDLQLGSSGPEVTGLQYELNCRPPSRQPPLVIDGIFGARTADRVREFQSNAGLMPDGIVGPLTLASLDGLGMDVPDRSGLDCGCSDASAPSLGLLVQQQLASATRNQVVPAFGQSRVASPANFAVRSPAVLAGFPSLPSPPRPLTAAQQATALPYYGSSLDFSRIYISDRSGISNRPFTISFYLGEVMNMGTFTPTTTTLIHELAHCWQSQHSADETLFMRSSVGAQAAAVTANLAVAALRPSVTSHKDFPDNYPMSAYAYRPSAGRSFGSYGAEQIANAVEHGDATIVAHVKAASGVDGDNMTSLNFGESFDDRRDPGVVY